MITAIKKLKEVDMEVQEEYKKIIKGYTLNDRKLLAEITNKKKILEVLAEDKNVRVRMIARDRLGIGVKTKATILACVGLLFITGNVYAGQFVSGEKDIYGKPRAPYYRQAPNYYEYSQNPDKFEINSYKSYG